MINKISILAQIGKNVQIGNFVTIYDNVVIDDNTIIGDYVILGVPANIKEKTLYIGKNSIIRSHTVLYEGSYFENQLETGHHVLIRENTRVGKNLRIGSFSDIEGDVKIGDYTRFHSYVHIGRGSKIGNFVWIYSLVTLTNDPLPPSHIERPVVIEDGVVICVNSTVLPGTIMRTGSFASSNSIVEGEIPEGAVVTERNKIRGHVCKLINYETGTRHPWMGHFYDKYPQSEYDRIKSLEKVILESYNKFRV